MFCRVNSATLTGVNADLVNVEVDLSGGIPYFAMTGILAAEIKEAGERVRTAIRNSGYNIPSSRIVVNISPAGIRKAGTALDLPIALGILADINIVNSERIKEFLVLGELSLDGSINKIKGVLPSVSEGISNNINRCIVPKENMNEACFIKGIKAYGVKSLSEAVFTINNEIPYESSISISNILKKNQNRQPDDFDEIAGQYTAKRATMIAAAGRHNIMYMGPPGSGKTMLASRIPGILPELTEQETIEISKIYSAAGLIDSSMGIVCDRPFRSPHHSITRSGLYGGGRYPLPGEITLAHGGVLFLDELPLFNMEILEGLRNPIERKSIKIIRNNHMVEFPSDFMLAAAMNPCKCGFYPDRNLCSCTEMDIARYTGRISRPLLDRFDICVRVDRPRFEEIAMSAGITNGAGRSHLTTFYMKTAVKKACEIQMQRYKGSNAACNSNLDNAGIKKYCNLDEESGKFIKKIYDMCNLSARGYNKILKVARTIADLDGKEKITMEHISEAAAFRSLDFGGEADNG